MLSVFFSYIASINSLLSSYKNGINDIWDCIFCHGQPHVLSFNALILDIKFLKDYLPAINSILDYGCGEMYFTNYLKNISSSINTLIIGLSFLLTFSFAFIGIGLFIVFIRSFFMKKSWITNIIKKTVSLNVLTWLRPLNSFAFTRNDFVNITTHNICRRRMN